MKTQLRPRTPYFIKQHIKGQRLSLSDNAFAESISVSQTNFLNQMPWQKRILYMSMFSFIRNFYDVEIRNAHLLPNDGPLLFASNHVSFVDAQLISSVLPYPIRFFIDEGIYHNRWLHHILRTMDTIPISHKRRTLTHAIETTKAATQEQQMLGIFPEGTVTYTGRTQPFKRGIHLLATQTNLPIVPVAIKGLWGSMFSRKHLGSLRRFALNYSRPKVTVTFGSAIPSHALELNHLQNTIENMIADA